MPYRAVECELWGVHNDVHVEDGLSIRRAVGAYGILYEVEVTSLWRVWRLHAVLTLLPRTAVYQIFDGDDDEEFGDGVLVLHYWEEHAENHVNAGGTWPPTSIRKPT